MVFIDYRQTLIVMVPISLISVGALGYWVLRRKAGFFAWAIARSTMIAIGSLGFLLLLAVGCAAGFTKTTRSIPVFSPDYTYAARVTDFDAGAIGGDTSVTVYANHGVRNATVLTGGWKIVGAQDVRWLTNSELLVEYPTDTGYDPPICKSFGSIKVTCRPTNRRTSNH